MDKKLNLESVFSDKELQRGLHVRIPTSLYELLEAEMKKRDQNLSELIRDLIALPFIPEIMKKKHALSTGNHNLIKECREYMNNLSESFKEVTQRQQLIEKARMKIQERLTKDDVKKMLIEDIAQKIIKDLFD